MYMKRKRAKRFPCKNAFIFVRHSLFGFHEKSSVRVNTAVSERDFFPSSKSSPRKVRNQAVSHFV